MRSLKVFFFNWGPVLFWMITIFLLSSRQRVSVSESDMLNFLFFKFLHMVEYATLYLLWFRALYRQDGRKEDAYMIALVACIAYAFSDEIHQTFVPTREGAIRDVFIDTIGITLMYTVIKLKLNVLKKYL